MEAAVLELDSGPENSEVSVSVVWTRPKDRRLSRIPNLRIFD